jgi:hypothetical protein
MKPERIRCYNSLNIDFYKRMVQMDELDDMLHRQFANQITQKIMSVLKDDIKMSKMCGEILFELDFMIIPSNEYVLTPIQKFVPSYLVSDSSTSE